MDKNSLKYSLYNGFWGIIGLVFGFVWAFLFTLIWNILSVEQDILPLIGGVLVLIIFITFTYIISKKIWSNNFDKVQNIVALSTLIFIAGFVGISFMLNWKFDWLTTWIYTIFFLVITNSNIKNNVTTQNQAISSTQNIESK